MEKAIRRGSFGSKKSLKKKILDFIDYFNETITKPSKWTYQGMVLNAQSAYRYLCTPVLAWFKG